MHLSRRIDASHAYEPAARWSPAIRMTITCGHDAEVICLVEIDYKPYLVTRCDVVCL